MEIPNCQLAEQQTNSQLQSPTQPRQQFQDKSSGYIKHSVAKLNTFTHENVPGRDNVTSEFKNTHRHPRTRANKHIKASASLFKSRYSGKYILEKEVLK